MQKADQKGAGLQAAESVGWGYGKPISDRVHDVVCVCQLCLGDTALWPPLQYKKISDEPTRLSPLCPSLSELMSSRACFPTCISQLISFAVTTSRTTSLSSVLHTPLVDVNRTRNSVGH